MKASVAKWDVLLHLRNTQRFGRHRAVGGMGFKHRTLMSLRREGIIEHFHTDVWYLTEKGRKWFDRHAG